MANTGHKTEKEFQKYIKLNDEEFADMYVKYANWSYTNGTNGAANQPEEVKN